MKIKCVYSNDRVDGVEYYGCNVSTALITKPGTEIKAFVGEHIPGKSNKDVEIIQFHGTTVEFFPRVLHKIFPKLTTLIISNCGLKSITREDLRGLEGLEKLYLSCNELQSLPSDLFVGMLKLKHISFFDNKLTLLTSKLLEPIAGNGMLYVDFCNNMNVNAFYSLGEEKSVASLQELMDLIDQKCSKPENEAEEEFTRNFMTGLKEMWKTKKFSDFTIIGGGGEVKEFAVHKNVLATQSTVLAAIFEHDMKEKQAGKMKIDDFSAEVIEKMLEFMYTGKLKENNAMDLFAIASKYNIATLKTVTEKMILRNLDESNAIEVFGLAHLYISDDMKRAAFEAIKKMFPDVELQESLMEKPEDLKEIFEARRERKRKNKEAKAAYQATMEKLNK